jgi:cytochrome c
MINASRRERIVSANAILALTFTIFLFFGCFSSSSAAPLHDAAKEGDVEKIEELLAQGADINESSALATPLHFAIQRGHAKAAELLIKRGANVNATSTWGTPLHSAAAAGLIDIARLLLERGADVNANWKGNVPLHIAARTGRTEIVLLLLDHGANINALTVHDEPALHLAIIQGHGDTADLLRQRGTRAAVAEEITELLASSDLAHGKQLALRCGGCHSMDQSGKVKKGPPLWDVVGRPKASFPKFAYSPAIKAAGGEWTYEALNNFLAYPAWTIPGTSMFLQGMHNPRDRADLISFLRTLSNNPAALP